MIVSREILVPVNYPDVPNRSIVCSWQSASPIRIPWFSALRRQVCYLIQNNNTTSNNNDKVAQAATDTCNEPVILGFTLGQIGP